jgi:ClpP class serine protease
VKAVVKTLTKKMLAKGDKAMAIPNLISAVNTPWAMVPSNLQNLMSVFDGKLNGTDAYQAMVALTQKTDFGEKQSSGWESHSFESKSGNLFQYLKVSGTLVPRTGSMKPYCGMIPSIQLASIIDSVAEGTLITHMDSGGGNIIGIPELTNAVSRAKERGVEMIFFTDTVMASAAYWPASHADTIIASPSSIVGSIGVYSVLTKKIEEKGYKTLILKAGGKKAYGHPDLELTDEEVASVQEGIDKSYSQFVSSVSEGLGLSEDFIRGTEAGTYTGLEAKENGLVHEVMTLDELFTKARNS